MQILATIVAIALIGVVLYDFASEYAKADTSTGWTRVWAAWSGGAANIKQQLGIVAAGVVAVSNKIVDWASDLLGDPTAADSVKTVITGYVTPQTVGLAMAVFTLVTVAMKLRKS